MHTTLQTSTDSTLHACTAALRSQFLHMCLSLRCDVLMQWAREWSRTRAPRTRTLMQTIETRAPGASRRYADVATPPTRARDSNIPASSDASSRTRSQTGSAGLSAGASQPLLADAVSIFQLMLEDVSRCRFRLLRRPSGISDMDAPKLLAGKKAHRTGDDRKPIRSWGRSLS